MEAFELLHWKKVGSEYQGFGEAKGLRGAEGVRVGWGWEGGGVDPTSLLSSNCSIS